MKKVNRKIQFVFIVSLLLITFSCQKKIDPHTQKTPKELSDEARIKQTEMEDSIQKIMAMKKELEKLKQVKVEKTCKCKKKVFTVRSKYAWVKFTMPESNQKRRLSVRRGSYKNPPFSVKIGPFNSLACSRVYWSDLLFECNPGSCTWKKISGDWKTSDQCLGTSASSGRIKYVTTGY